MSKSNDSRSARVDDDVQAAVQWMLEHYGVVAVKEFTAVDFNTLYRARDGITEKMQAGTRKKILHGYEMAKAALGDVRSDALNNRTEDRMIEAYREHAGAYDLPAWDTLTEKQRETWEKHWRAYISRLEAAESSFLQLALEDFAAYFRASRTKIL